jgi:hypothetical protein
MKMQNSFGQNLFHSSEFTEGLFGDQRVPNKDPTVWFTHKSTMQVLKIGIFLVLSLFCNKKEKVVGKLTLDNSEFATHKIWLFSSVGGSIDLQSKS